MPAGRPAKPVSAKLLSGNPGGRPLNEHAPKIPLGKPERAKWLRSKAGRRAFAKIYELCASWMTPLDSPLFNIFCHQYALYEYAAEELNRTGPVIEETRATKSGETYTVEMISPYYHVMQTCAEKVLTYAQKLAIPVHERDRLIITGGPEKRDEMEELVEHRATLTVMPNPADIEVSENED